METTSSKITDARSITSVEQILRFTFGIVPIVAGADKFTNLLTHWVNYLNPHVAGMLPFSGEIFMKIVGVIEIIAGLLVLIKPRVGALVVSAWLVLIALQLIVGGMYLDVAVRDLVMAISAFLLFRIASLTEK
jgi:uncharacterized membrane protein HdeD (DUF308 family)